MHWATLLFELYLGTLSAFQKRDEEVRRLRLTVIALHQQLTILKRQSKQPKLTQIDRDFWVHLRENLDGWKEALVIVTPGTSSAFSETHLGKHNILGIMVHVRKPFRLLGCEIQTPPMGDEARWAAGDALRRIQEGESLPMPLSRPMPSIGPRIGELRIRDAEKDCIWRIFYRIDDDAVIVAEVLQKKTEKTPKRTIDLCKERFDRYDRMRSATKRPAEKGKES